MTEAQNKITQDMENDNNDVKTTITITTTITTTTTAWRYFFILVQWLAMVTKGCAQHPRLNIPIIHCCQKILQYVV